MSRHTGEEIQEMFEAFGLGTEARRAAVRALAAADPSNKIKLPGFDVLHCDNATAVRRERTGQRHAELARNPEGDSD